MQELQNEIGRCEASCAGSSGLWCGQDGIVRGKVRRRRVRFLLLLLDLTDDVEKGGHGIVGNVRLCDGRLRLLLMLTFVNVVSELLGERIGAFRLRDVHLLHGLIGIGGRVSRAGRLASRSGDDVLHLDFRTQEQFHGLLTDDAAILLHGLPRIVIRIERDERVASLAADNVHAT